MVVSEIFPSKHLLILARLWAIVAYNAACFVKLSLKCHKKFKQRKFPKQRQPIIHITVLP